MTHTLQASKQNHVQHLPLAHHRNDKISTLQSLVSKLEDVWRNGAGTTVKV